MAKAFQIDTGGTLLANLVAYYPLADRLDVVGTHHFTNYSSATFPAGKVGNCVSLNGASYLRSGTPVSGVIANLSMFMWVYLSGTSLRGCFANNGADAILSSGYGIGVGSTDMDTLGNNLIGLCDNVGWMNFNKAIGAAGWHWVGFTRGASVWTGYVDNVASATTFTTTPVTPTSDWIVGANCPLNPYAGNSLYRRMFTGKVDELGFWTKVLSTQERADLYNGGAGQTMVDPGIPIKNGQYRRRWSA